ncbi:magnesium chelatase subunit D [Sphingomonas sp. SFZ2018-12]|uniref:magnesium chelatase subunit D n=2 Tax=unclassified Sphingomonas TaxID=196159 RepID=UPI001F0F56FB|nr:magnesium chelatase subunit D [Sphingomonas sp. SFZ2018-12]MCH4891947.1 magnesium chelatase subunit D [Sphingomonas sp. SFZ2018-12]
MNPAGDVSPVAELDPIADALLAARLCAVDPMLGGMTLRGASHEIAEAIVAAVRAGLGADAPVRRVPGNVDLDRLIGGLDLGSTLALGRPVAQRGLLAEAAGGAVVLPMAERAADNVVSQIAAVIDTGDVVLERDGMASRTPARFVTIALDEGQGDERVAPALTERLAFAFDVVGVRSHSPFPCRGGEGGGRAPQALRQMDSPHPNPSPEGAGLSEIGRAAGRSVVWWVGAVAIGDAQVEALAGIAAALGVASIRAPIFALRAARALARLDGRAVVSDDDVALAVRLVLVPRATRLPDTPEAEPAEPDAPSPPPESSDRPADESQDAQQPQKLDDVVLDAVLAQLPPDMLAAIAEGNQARGKAGAGGAGERRRSPTRGRPVGTRAGIPRHGLRLSLIDTIRAAAPWQRLRGRDDARVRIRKDDLRIRRFETRAEATTIFAVDASGSAALARLAEAKGAVELMLGEAYVKRAQVALVAFRGEGAELLLPPTRSLARARRALGELPGGGGTPIAAGLHAALELAQAAKARGRTPFVVVLTDGRANVTLAGLGDRTRAQAEAQAAARMIAEAGVAGAFVDISPRPRPEGALLAAAMRARYLALPRADAREMHRAVKAVQA